MFLPCRIYEGGAIVLSQDVRSRRSPLMADGIMDDARSLHTCREVTKGSQMPVIIEPSEKFSSFSVIRLP